MAIVPSGQKFHTVPQGVNTQEKGSALANSQREIYTMQDIIDTVGGGGGSSPLIIDSKVSGATAVTGTTSLAISQSILIPANTFTAAGGMLEILARYQKTGTGGNQSTFVLINTANNLTGAETLAWFNASPFLLVQGIRTAKVTASTIEVFNAGSALVNDYIGSSNAPSIIPFDPTVDNYLLFAITLAGVSDSSIVEMARAVKYE
jgi:hypothetical protein